MRRALKIILIVIAVAAAVAVAVPLLVPTDTVKTEVLARIEQATGRSVSMGKVTFSVFPGIALSAADVKIGNPAWAGGGDMAEIKSLRLGVELTALLHKEIRIKELTLIEPVILLVKNGAQANWQFGKAQDARAAAQPPVQETKETIQSAGAFLPAGIRIQDGSVTYKDSALNSAMLLSGVDVTTKVPPAVAEDNRKAGISVTSLDLQVVIGSLKLPKTTLSDIHADVRLKDGTLHVTIHPLAAYAGTISAAFETNSSGTLNFTAAASGVQAQPLLQDFAGSDKLSGTLAFHISGSATGPSQRAMIRSLTGKGDFAMKDGALRGRNILAMAQGIRSAFDGAYGESTYFSRLSGTFVITNGVVSNTDLALSTPLLRAQGNGTVDLPGWQVNYLLNPILASSITVPIRIEGSLDHPRYRPDVRAALMENLKDPERMEKNVKKLLDNGGLGGLLR